MKSVIAMVEGTTIPVLVRGLSTQQDMWSDLPAELLAIVAGENHADISRLRSVCRSRRSALPPYNHPLFPLTVSFCWEGRRLEPPVHLTATTVYLVRHLHDAGNFRMVAVQESSAGKLLLQHPLTDVPIPGSPGTLLDLSEWRVTTIATFYRDNIGSSYLDNVGGFLRQNKVVLVPDSKAALCRHPQLMNHLCAFITDDDPAAVALSLVAHRHGHEIEDFVWFDGWVYLVESTDLYENYTIFRLEHKTWQRFEIVCDTLRDYISSVNVVLLRFVVFDGDLYIVVTSTEDIDEGPFLRLSSFSVRLYTTVDECRVFRLVRNDKTCCRWERVDNLGDTLFFVIRTDSFSVSARDLPPPWKGNCVVVNTEDFECCLEVFDLGVGRYSSNILTNKWRRLSSLGYPNLFTSTTGTFLRPQTT